MNSVPREFSVKIVPLEVATGLKLRRNRFESILIELGPGEFGKSNGQFLRVRSVGFNARKAEVEFCVCEKINSFAETFIHRKECVMLRHYHEQAFVSGGFVTTEVDGGKLNITVEFDKSRGIAREEILVAIERSKMETWPR